MAHMRHLNVKENLLVASVIACAVVAALSLKVAVRTSQNLAHEQRVTAVQARTACIRSRVFGPPFISHIERVEARLHTGALEGKVEWPIGSHKTESVLKFYRSTIPETCPKP